MSGRFAELATELVAVTGELTLDDELIAATRRLEVVAIEADAVEKRFQAACADVQMLLLRRLMR